jgi:galactokinase
MESLPSFVELFGRPPSVCADAPGRVNLIGEHTDYNGGFVLPAVIPQRTRVELAVRGDLLVRAWTANMPLADRLCEFEIGSEKRQRVWIDYVAGVTAGLRLHGHTPQGFDMRIESDVPVGSGLSSSAALEISVAAALRAALHLRLTDVELARIGQWAENQFVGAPTGIMDQMVVGLGEAGSAFFLDTRSLTYEHVKIPQGVELVVIDSGLRHRHAAGDYASRRAQCDEACRLLGIQQLRDLTIRDMPRIESLPGPIGRRARHVVTENERVLQAVDAMREGDGARLGRLFHASHLSMRDDFDLSIPEIDKMVDIADADPGIYGARLTGGGFGGSVVMLAKQGAGQASARTIAAQYASATGQTPAILVP